jgi:hypothetical protein
MPNETDLWFKLNVLSSRIARITKRQAELALLQRSDPGLNQDALAAIARVDRILDQIDTVA